MKVGSLFSGIGGIDLGLQRAGMEIAWQAESDPFCRAILARNFTSARYFKSVEEISQRVVPVDIVAGGFPCQPVSYAGYKRGSADKRWLWPEFRQVISKLEVAWVLIENVPGIQHNGLSGILQDLAALGYDAEWRYISAEAFGAPHKRERLFVVAYLPKPGLASPRVFRKSSVPRNAPVPSRIAGCGFQCRTSEASLEQDAEIRARKPRMGLGWWRCEPAMDRMVYGISDRVDRTKALGNAVVPFVAEFVGRLIIDADRRRNA